MRGLLQIQKRNLTINTYTFLVCLYAVFRIFSCTCLGLDSIVSIVNYVCISGLAIVFMLQSKITLRKLALSFVVTIIVGIVCYRVFDMPFFISYLFILAFPIGLSLDNLAKKMCSCYIISISIVIILCIMDVIEDYTIYQHGILRHSLGFTSPNACANFVTTTIMLFSYYKFPKWKKRYSILGIAISYLIYSITNSRLAFYTAIATILITYIVNKTELEWISSVIFKISSYVFGLLSAICVGGTMYFSSHQSAMFDILNILTTYRTNWMVNYYQEYGIHFLGQHIVSVSRMQALTSGINWSGLDNSYVLFAIKYGLILLCSLIFLYYKLGKYLKRNNNIAGAICVVIMCIIGVTENYLLIVGYNFTIFFIGEMISNNKLETENNDIDI